MLIVSGGTELVANGHWNVLGFLFGLLQDSSER